MKLLDYLQSNFLSMDTLLAQTDTELECLRDLQEKNCMPACSYRLNNDLTCKSPIKAIETTIETEYYARGYSTWLTNIRLHGDSTLAFQEFESRYMKQVERILQNELQNYAAPWIDAPRDYILTEWNHFLEGTYGVCTKNGLPEQIATKELSAARINEIIQLEEPDRNTKDELRSVVDLMDSACSEFAPHELEGSSRQRLIDDVRKQFQFEAPFQMTAN